MLHEASALTAPSLRPEDRSALREFWLFYEPHAGAIQDEVLRACRDMPEWAPIFRTMTALPLAEQTKRLLNLQRAALMEGQWQPYLADLHAQGMQYAQGGTSFSAWFQIISAFRDCIQRRLAELARTDLTRAVVVREAMNRFLDIVMIQIGEAYLATKEQIIHEHQRATLDSIRRGAD
jgi:hypothetical protein